MDVRDIIKALARNQEYDLTDHCLDEMDKDGLSIEQVEYVMLKGTIVKRCRETNRYTLKNQGIMISVELSDSGEDYFATVVTAGKERR